MTTKEINKKYRNFPEVLEISKSRERKKIFSYKIIGIILAGGSICFCVDFATTWPMIFPMLGAGIYFYHLFVKYDEITEQKIQQAIADNNKLTKKIKEK